MTSLLNLPSTPQVTMAVMRKPVSARRSVKKRRSGRYKIKSTSLTKTGANRPGMITGLSRSDFGFPDRVTTKLVYGDAVDVTVTSSSIGYTTFRLNSLFDPDYTNTGHQPQWYDSFQTVYRNYRVKGAKISVEFMPKNPEQPGTSVIGPYIVGITTSNQTTLSASSAASLTEDANGATSILQGRDSGRSIVRLSNTYSPLRDLGLQPNDPDLSPVCSSNPSTAFYAHLFAFPLGGNASSVVSMRVKIEFQCEFFNRIEGVLS